MPGHRSLAWIVPPMLIAALPTFAWLAVGPRAAAGLLGGPPGIGLQLSALTAGLAAPEPDAGSGTGEAASVPEVVPLAALPPCGGSAETTTVEQAPVASGEPGNAAPASVADYRMSDVLSPNGSLAGWELVTRVGGSIGRVALPPESAARGPVGGRVAVAADDGERSEIRLVSAAASCGAIVHGSDDVIRRAVLAPDGEAVLFHAVGREDRADRGIWRLPLSGGGAPAALLPAIGADHPVRDDVGLVWSTELRTAHDGRLLAVESCGEEVCRTRIAGLGPNLEAARSLTYPGRLVGLDGRSLVALRDCEGPVCTLVATDLSTGQERLLRREVHSATTLVLGGRLFGVAIVTSAQRPSLVVVEAATGRTWTGPEGLLRLLAGPAGAMELVRLLPPGGSGEAGSELLPGWVATAMATGRAAAAIDVAAILAADEPEASR